jgi:hypothetical protein
VIRDTEPRVARAFTIWRRVTGPCMALAIVVACGSSQSESKSSIPCTNSDECWHSDEMVTRLGRCVSEVYCEANRCDGHCLQPCEVVDPLFNPCQQSGLICNEPLNKAVEAAGAIWSCTALPISCIQVEDCPVFRPDATGAWQCVDNVCQFPGFSYAVQPM